MESEQFQNDPSKLSYDKDLHQNASMDLDFTTFLAMFSIVVIFYYVWKMIQRKAQINTNEIGFIPEKKGGEKKTPLFEDIKFKSPQKKDENNDNNNNNNSSGNKKDKKNNGSNKKAPSSDNKKKNSDHLEEEEEEEDKEENSHFTPVKEKNNKSEGKGKEDEEIDFLSPISSVIAKTRLAKTQLKKRRSSYGLVDHSIGPTTTTATRTTVKKNPVSSVSSSSFSTTKSRPVTRSSQRYCPINVLEKNSDQLTSGGTGGGERERGGAGSSDSSSITPVSITVQ
jgi:hypothetical protein